MKKAISVLLLLFLSGCAGSLGLALNIRGIAPQHGRCVIKVTRYGTDEVIGREKVSGRFSTAVIVSGRDRSRFGVVAECDGQITKMLKDVSPAGDKWELQLDLGDISP